MYLNFGSRKDFLFQFVPNFRLYIIGAAKYRPNLVSKSLRTIKRHPYFKKIMKMLPKERIPMNRFGQSIDTGLFFLLINKSSKHFIPNNQNITVVLVQINLIATMMYTVMRWGDKNFFKNPQTTHRLRMRKKWVHTVNQ
ncbi:hypothetical protein D3C71_1594860 [compost metagenome]